MSMPMPAQGGFLCAYFAAAAERERDVRLTHYPKWVEEGRIETGKARAEIEAWRAIATLFGAGTVETGLSWAELVYAAGEALQRREEAVAAKPGNADLVARRDAVAGIYERLEWHRSTIMRAPSPSRAGAARGTLPRAA
jgi:hypothetical protein